MQRLEQKELEEILRMRQTREGWETLIKVVRVFLERGSKYVQSMALDGLSVACQIDWLCPNFQRAA